MNHDWKAIETLRNGEWESQQVEWGGGNWHHLSKYL